MNWNKLIVFILLITFIYPAQATLTPARIPEKATIFGIEAIPNLGFSGEYGLRKKLGIGGSLSLFNARGRSGFVNNDKLFRSDESTYFEIHATYLYRQYSQDLPFYLGFLGGIWGTASKIGLAAGVIVDIPISQKWDARFNLVLGPRLGAELTYRVQKNVEFCLDIGYAAGILGTRIYF